MLLYFILGILFISIGIPILENIESIISAFSEYIVYYFAYKVYQLKQQFAPDEDKQEEKKDFPVGFHHTEAIGYEVQTSEQ